MKNCIFVFVSICIMFISWCSFYNINKTQNSSWGILVNSWLLVQDNIDSINLNFEGWDEVNNLTWQQKIYWNNSTSWTIIYDNWGTLKILDDEIIYVNNTYWFQLSLINWWSWWTIENITIDRGDWKFPAINFNLWSNWWNSRLWSQIIFYLNIMNEEDYKKQEKIEKERLWDWISSFYDKILGKNGGFYFILGEANMDDDLFYEIFPNITCIKKTDLDYNYMYCPDRMKQVFTWFTLIK